MKNLVSRTLSCTLAVLTAAPALGGESTRKTINPQAPYAKITGQISQPGNKNFYGNGFIVGRDGCNVLTNFHVAFGTNKNVETGEVETVDNPSVGHEVVFAYDLDAKSGKFTKTMKAKVVEFGNYEPGTTRGLVGDVTLLRLETCLGPAYAGPELDRPDSKKRVPAGRLKLVSSLRATDGKNEMFVEEGCRAHENSRVTGLFTSNCHSQPGMSGAMILEEGQDSKWRLVGLNIASGQFKDGTSTSVAIYSKVVSPFVDKVIGEEGPIAITPLADDRKPQSDTAMADAKPRTVVR